MLPTVRIIARITVMSPRSVEVNPISSKFFQRVVNAVRAAILSVCITG